MGWLREHTDETLTGAEPEQSSAVKTRLRLFRLAHMNDGHENGQASVLFLYSPPSKGFPCQYPQIMRRPFWKAAPRFRRIPRGRPAGHAEAGPCELSHRRLHHEDGASLAPGAPPWAADSSESMRRRQRRRLRPPSSASLTSGYGREETRPRSDCPSPREFRPLSHE